MDTFKDLLTFLVQLAIQLVNAIPDTILGAIVAGIFVFGAARVALRGVRLQNGVHTNNLKMQLKSASEESSIERISSARRAVYLNYADRSTKAFETLGAMPKIDTYGKGVPSEISAFSSAMTQASLVADSATAILLVRMSTKLANLQRELLVKSGPMMILLHKIDVFSRHRDDAKAEGRKLREEMQILYEDGEQFQLHFSQLRHKAEDCETDAKQFDTEIAEFNRQLLKEQSTYSDFLFSNLPALSDANIAVLVAFRRELGITTDDDLIKELVVSRDGLLEATNAAIQNALRS